jgi:hypothetical protein
MAYIRNPLGNEQDTQQQSGGVVGTDGQSITGNSNKPVSNWTNLNAYVQGNQGAGGQIADKMLEQGNKDVNAAEVAGNDFAKNTTEQVNKGIKQDTAGYGDMFKSGDVSNLSNEQKQAYTEWSKAPAYSGPKDASQTQDYSNLQGATETATKQAAKSYTQQGQYGLAGESLGKGNQNYTGGMGMLDTVLARQTGGGQKLDEFNTKNTKEAIEGKSKAKVDQVNQAITSAQSQGEANQNRVKGNLQGRLTDYEKILADREAANKQMGDNMFEQDQFLADYASDPEFQAIRNLSELGGTLTPAQQAEMLTRSGRPRTTVAQSNAITAPTRDAVTALENNSILDQILNAPETKNGATVIDPNAPVYGNDQFDAFGNPI